MFSTSLFRNIACPDLSCTRQPCPYSHKPLAQLPTSSIATLLTGLNPQRTDPPAPITSNQQTKRPGSESADSLSSNEPPRKVQKLSHGPTASSSRRTTAPAAPLLLAAGAGIGLPTAPLNPTDTKIPLKLRQAMLKLLHEWFSFHYLLIAQEHPSLATEHALKQELEIHEKTNKLSYRNAAITAIASMKKRDKPDSISHPAVGTEGMLTERKQVKNSLGHLRLTSNDLRSLVMSQTDMERFGYVVQVPLEAGGLKPTEEGNSMRCERCKEHFEVKRMADAATECVHHWGRCYVRTTNGEKVRIYKCCSEPYPGTGCVTGRHVFYETDAKDLHSRHAFTLTSPPVDPSPVLDVACIDCEAIYTTQGMSIARVSVVNGQGLQVFDQLVKLDSGVEVIDYNTRFSGITSLDEAKLDLHGVRHALRALIGPDTILIGHSLDSDLRMMRLVHYNVIDTTMLFPHPHGMPYRRALRDLVREHLGAVIQAGGAEVGHSSVEDAIATMNLVKWYVLEKRKTSAAGLGRA